MSFLKSYLMVFLLLLTLTNCKENESAYEGDLTVQFSNQPSDLSVSIFTLDNPTIPIYSNITLTSNGVFKQKLNIGNYFIQSFSASGVFFPNFGFQIKPDKTTAIYYDSNNTPVLRN